MQPAELVAIWQQPRDRQSVTETRQLTAPLDVYITIYNYYIF